MNSLDDFWRNMFGVAITNFEEMLMVRGAHVMTPEEPLFAVFGMMVRVLHETQGEAEKALLKFAPELTDRAQSLIRACDDLEDQLASLNRRGEEFSGMLRVLESKSMTSGSFGFARHAGFVIWVQKYIAPIATSVIVLAFCTGFVIASLVRG